ncbi:sensor domain-containing protein [Streptomyces sp. ASQP_92]|uniref:sensor histidine kinase n=1 Tax=Streptomyces sp. ASQP_92 TaxID=2979116 RepID=UPI0021C032CC|nr:sensor domain-containing protein [Streptomyces sp. ASQP_92]MCT9087805.1 sensor domain-containing protein [Streptomyces sp. ASQP_92]
MHRLRLLGSWDFMHRRDRPAQVARAALYSLIALPLALAGLALVLAVLFVGAVLSWTALGLWLVAAAVHGALLLGGVQRALARRLLGLGIEPPERMEGSGVFGWRRSVLGGRPGWRAVGCALAAPLTALLPLLAVYLGVVQGVLLTLYPVLKRWNYFTIRESDGSVRHVGLEVGGVELDSWPRWLLPFAAGLLLLYAAPWLIRHALTPHRLLLTALLGPDRADQRIRTLEETRAQAVDDAAATLRRIERDLHDGTQARLVGLGMHLTMIRELVAGGAERDRILKAVETAQGNAKQAVADLRHLVKGIHPPALDQGLQTALATLAADSALPVRVSGGIEGRPSPAIESIAYFCTAELLTNAAKHSGASEVSVTVHGAAKILLLTVEDNGRGGAVVGAGSGLAGLRARVRTVDGSLTCDSPPGGPTVVSVLLPFR